MKDEKRLHIRIPGEMYYELKSLGRGMSNFIRRAIAHKLITVAKIKRIKKNNKAS
jgi:hypothetical protein